MKLDTAKMAKFIGKLYMVIYCFRHALEVRENIHNNMAEYQNELSVENDIAILEDSPSDVDHPSAIPPSSHRPEFQIYTSPQASLGSSQFALQTAYNDLKKRYNQLDGKHRQLVRAVKEGRVGMASRNVDSGEDTAPRSGSPVTNGQPESVGSDLSSAQFRSLEMRSKYLESEIYKLQVEVRNKQQEVDRLTSKLKRIEADNKRLINESQAIKDKIQTMITRHKMEIAELQENLSKLSDEKEASKSRVEVLDTTLKRKERELAGFKKQCLELDRQLKDALKEKEEEKQVYLDRLSLLQNTETSGTGIGEKELLGLKFQIEAVKKDNENLKKMVREQHLFIEKAVQREKAAIRTKERTPAANPQTSANSSISPRASSPQANASSARDVMTESYAIPCSEDVMQDELGMEPGQDMTYATMIPATGNTDNLTPDGQFGSLPSETGGVGSLNSQGREEALREDQTADPDEGLGGDSMTSDQGDIFGSALMDIPSVSPRNTSHRSRGSASNPPLSGNAGNSNLSRSGSAGNNMAGSRLGPSSSNNQRSTGSSVRNTSALNFERNEEHPQTRDNSKQNPNLYTEEPGGSKLGSPSTSPTVLNNDPLLGHKVGMIPSKNLLCDERSQPEGATIHIPLRDNMDEYDRICPSCNRVFPVSMPMEELQQHVMDCMPGETSGIVHNSFDDEGPVNTDERVCPMCSAAFPKMLPQTDFESHVNSHFEDETSMVSQYEVLSGN
ncbi:uncharacterized protein LOC106161000 isoform X2 [Lingula anatina]|uniref:Uncharacterized protein LOC106161000 isoform X2 n=1 Tax=Lingula anatina TaxID=7574 RepID=A0A1S3I4U5_LINAN|nr:uncharacterized protein LOC106161000 isoform X2 [Lingula anatina]|eukprot:XP_013393290.1 uncharacterized protein LOC106161000 isoform X2 [Lingula anatina]